MGVLETRLSVYVGFVVEGMNTRDTGYFVNEPLCLHLCCCKGYVHI